MPEPVRPKRGRKKVKLAEQAKTEESENVTDFEEVYEDKEDTDTDSTLYETGESSSEGPFVDTESEDDFYIKENQKELKHCLTHQPADPDNCDTCRMASLKHRRRSHGNVDIDKLRENHTWGVMVLDHGIMRDVEGLPGVKDFNDLLCCMCVGTG